MRVLGLGPEKARLTDRTISPRQLAIVLARVRAKEFHRSRVGFGMRYRLLLLDVKGETRMRYEFECSDNATAIKQAMEIVGQDAFQLWQDNRLIHQVKPPPT